jgi:hypothetical protein
MASFDDLFKVLSDQARIGLSGMVGDVNKQVLPSMASLAQNLVTIADLKATDPDYTVEMAKQDFQAQVDAAVSVLVRFANATLLAVQEALNAVLAAISAAIDKLIGFSLLAA